MFKRTKRPSKAAIVIANVAIRAAYVYLGVCIGTAMAQRKQAEAEAAKA